MGNLFLHALVVDLKQTQRTLLPHCFFCVPQPRSLLVDKVVNQGNRRLGDVLRRKREVHFLSLLKRRHHKYTFDYHFLHLNTTALGFIIANFQVAIEYFLKRKDHKNDCKVCLELASQDGNAGSCCFQMIPELNCVRAAYKIR
ncbi:unnamed protein product [Peronospora effusa]|nr:unnamed protein product [Peronospora effusa]